MTTWSTRLATAVLLLSVGIASPVAAHDEGVLKTATRQLTAGDSVNVTGEKFGAASTLKLFLVGVTGRIGLPDVKADASGAFSITVLIPAEAAAGAYRLVAIAADGDEAAGLDLSVSEARQVVPEHDVAEPTHAEEPSDVPLELVRARSSLATGGAISIIAVSVVLGLGLLRNPARP